MNRETSQGPVAALLPIMGVVFIAFLIIGMAMPVLPLHVHQGLGLSMFVVGLVAGSQFAASLLSLRFVDYPEVSVVVLLLGRTVLGAGESFIITGAQTWGLALAGTRNTGKVLAWMGSAMYAAFALGAPIGTTLYGAYGFTAIALATTLVPLAALLLAAPVRRVAPTGRTHASL